MEHFSVINCQYPDDGRGCRTASRRVLVVIVVLACGATMGSTGLDPATVVTTVTSLGLVGAATARMVLDGAGGADGPALGNGAR